MYFATTSPIAFQKLASLTTEPLAEPEWSEARHPLDISALIASIPYSGSEGIAAVLPSEMYERTLLDGGGNCANKSRGLAYYLEQRGLPSSSYISSRRFCLSPTRNCAKKIN